DPAGSGWYRAARCCNAKYTVAWTFRSVDPGFAGLGADLRCTHRRAPNQPDIRRCPGRAPALASTLQWLPHTSPFAHTLVRGRSERARSSSPDPAPCDIARWLDRFGRDRKATR